MKFLVLFPLFFLSIISAIAQVKAIEVYHYVLPEFTKGIVLMKSGLKSYVLLNYNTLTEEMIFKDKGKTLAIGYTETQLTDTIFISDRKFIPLNDKFVELIFNSKSILFAENKCNVIFPSDPAPNGGKSQTSATTSISSYKSGGAFYELKLPDDHELKPYTHYWLRRNGELIKFVNTRQLMKLYQDKKSLCKSYLKSHSVEIDNQESIVDFIAYMEEYR